MARRNREINIFNMSLLDILCGALGAFCFMMLALLPYYKPPGAETAIRETQQKTEDLMKKIKEAGQKMDASPAVEDLRQLVEELRKQIQEMQGQLNLALSKNEELTKRNAELAAQNAALTTRFAALTEENEKLKEMLKRMTSADALAEMQKRIEQLQQQLQQLAAKNTELAEKNAALGQRVQNRTPISISLRFDTNQNVDLCLEDAARGPNSRRFLPAQRLTPKLWPDDVYLSAAGITIYTLPESPTAAEYRLFVNLVSTPENRRVTALQTTIYYGNWPAIELPAMRLTPARPWQLYGTIKKAQDGKLTFLPASTAERDANWTELTKQPVPVETPSTFVPPLRPVPSTPTPEPPPSGNTSKVPGLWKKSTPLPNSTNSTPPVKP